jgi:thioredoxin reductase (NADPH)
VRTAEQGRNVSTMKNQHTHHSSHPDAWHDVPDDQIAQLEHEARFAAPMREKILQQVAPSIDRDPQAIVDLGSGIGADAVALATRFASAQVHALDVSASLLTRVKSAATAANIDDRVTTHQCDLNEQWSSELPSGIDLAWSSLALHHLADPAATVREVWASLRPGGVFVLTELTGDSPVVSRKVGADRQDLTEQLSSAFSAPHEYAAIKWPQLLVDAGFESINRFDHDLTVSTDSPEGARYVALRLQRFREQLVPESAGETLRLIDATLEGISMQRDSVSARSTRAVWVAVRSTDEHLEASAE